MFRTLSIALLGTAVFMPLARAQMRIAASGQPAGPAYGISSGAARSGPSGFQVRAGMQHAQHSPLLFGASYFYSDDFSIPPMVEAPPPQVIVMLAPAAVEVAKEPRAEPLLIEWQGDRYVRINGGEGSARGVYAPTDYAAAKPPARPTVRITSAPPTPLAPTVLVYRDGRREEIQDYTIADGVIYARGDYWIDGYWNKKIPLNALDLSASMKASQERGVKFALPASPNEVITRP